MKKLITSLMLIALLVASCSIVYGYDSVNNGIERYFYSYGYSTNGNLKVMNIYTSGTPAADDLVTIYNYSGSGTQQWKIVQNQNLPGISTDSYRIISLESTNLCLNYQQSTTKCTMYYYGSLNDYHDYPVAFESVTGGHTIWLYYRDGRYLGNSGSSNGSQCYWYLIGASGIHSEDIWGMMTI